MNLQHYWFLANADTAIEGVRNSWVIFTRATLVVDVRPNEAGLSTRSITNDHDLQEVTVLNAKIAVLQGCNDTITYVSK